MEDGNGIYISNNKLKKLNDFNNLDINDLMGLFKSGNKDVLLNILSFEKYYVMGMIKKQLNKYDIVIPRYQYKDLYDYITFELIKGIDNSVMRYPGQIISYFKIIVMYKTLEYIIENIYNKSYCYSDCLDSMKNYKYIEY